MQWSIRQPFVPPPVLDRLDHIRLRRAALRYAAHGWTVTPGAWLSGHRFDCGRPGCPITGCHPALASWEQSASDDPGDVAAWWRRRPCTVLLTTGERFDVLEVPDALGSRVLDAVRRRDDGRSDVCGPVAVTAAGSWMFLVRPGHPLRPELEHRIDVVRHGRGSWIPVAPSRMPQGPVRWAVTPDQARWRLPDAEQVQTILVDAIRGPRPVLIPRQLSTLRRAA